MRDTNKGSKIFIPAFLVLFLLCLPSSGAEEANPEDKGPLLIGNFRATGGDKRIVLSWANPEDTNFAGVKIIRREGSYPHNMKDGIEVYDGKDASYSDTNPTCGVYYYYAAFTYDKEGNFSPTTSQGSAVAIDSRLVYYGQPGSYSKPASLVLQKVLQVIPAYRKLVASKPSSDKPEYWLLMAEINRDLGQAFKKVKEKFGYDLIGEKGYLSPAKEKLPDITRQTIECLPAEK